MSPVPSSQLIPIIYFLLQGAGAHLLELNFSCPQMARADAGHHIGQQFGLIEKFTAAAKRAVNIPVIAKMTPNITDMVPAALAAQVRSDRLNDL